MKPTNSEINVEYTMADLRKIAKKYGVKGTDKMVKKTLIKAIHKAQMEAVTEGKTTGTLTETPAPTKAIKVKDVKEQYTLKEICEQVGIDPKAARRTLRKIRGANNVAYVFNHDDAKKVIKAKSFEVLA